MPYLPTTEEGKPVCPNPECRASGQIRRRIILEDSNGDGECRCDVCREVFDEWEVDRVEPIRSEFAITHGLAKRLDDLEPDAIGGQS